MNALAKVDKDTVFLIEENAFNRFKTKEEMMGHLAILRGMAEQITESVPVSLEIAIWPSTDLFLMGHPAKSPVRTLYSVLSEVLASSGFSIGVLMTLEVENHEPYDTTAIRVEGRYRIFTVH